MLNSLSAAFRWKDGKVFLAKCTQPLDIRWSRQLTDRAEPSTITVKLSPSGRWTVSLLVDVEIAALPASQESNWFGFWYYDADGFE